MVRSAFFLCAAITTSTISCNDSRLSRRPGPEAGAAEVEAMESGIAGEDLDELRLAINESSTQGNPRYSRARLVARSASNMSGTLWVYKAKKRVPGHGRVEGVRINADIEGLTPNQDHGFHIHTLGSCASADAASAGGHFNPTNTQHGAPPSSMHHAGDLGNIKADAKGDAKFSVFIPFINIQDLMNRTFIIHKDPDDGKSQPAGNAGPRHGCALIAPYPGRTPVQPVKEVSTELMSQAAPAPQVKGKLFFADTPQGLHIWGDVSGLTPNAEHGMHVHENKASCVGDFATVGGHFDPTGTKNHGDPNGAASVHLGDLGNIKADGNGAAKVSIVRQGLTIKDVQSGILGRAIIVHAERDDLQTQSPPGKSGARIGCGVIAEK